MYQAIICTLDEVSPHPNADRLALAKVLGSHEIVVGIDSQPGQVGVYFPTDGKLSEEYCIQNDLYPRFDPETGNKIGGGMFDPKNRRVRAQNLRSVKSDGYFTELETLAYTGVPLDQLYVGFQFSSLNDHEICEKYFTPQTLRAMKGGTTATKKKMLNFPEHWDTEQFAYKASEIPFGSLCYITLKLEGTSHRIARALVTSEKKRWFQRKARVTSEYQIVHGTRRVVLGDRDNSTGYHGTDTFRYNSTEALESQLYEGEILYGEVVGYVNDYSLIAGEVATKDLKKDKQFKALFNGSPPETMKYTYGNLPGQQAFWVYRIARSDSEGNLVELSWPQVKARCRELDVPHVPDMAGPTLIETQDDLDALQFVVESLNDGLDPIDSSHIREGVVIRIEQPDGKVKALKSKGIYYKILASIIKNADDYIDIEESN